MDPMLEGGCDDRGCKILVLFTVNIGGGSGDRDDLDGEDAGGECRDNLVCTRLLPLDATLVVDAGELVRDGKGS